MMTEEQAEEINALCVAHAMFRLGVIEERPRTLEGFSLSDLIEARNIVRDRGGKANPDGTRTYSTTCDDRLLAALYVAHNYPGVDPSRDMDPIAVAGKRAVVVVRIKEGA